MSLSTLDDSLSCLTSYFGLDYFDIINDQIKMILYPKPSTTKSQIKELVKNMCV